eukprot:3735248-Amphidinium_carterae.2
MLATVAEARFAMCVLVQWQLAEFSLVPDFPFAPGWKLNAECIAISSKIDISSCKYQQGLACTKFFLIPHWTLLIPSYGYSAHTNYYVLYSRKQF